MADPITPIPIQPILVLDGVIGERLGITIFWGASFVCLLAKLVRSGQRNRGKEALQLMIDD